MSDEKVQWYISTPLGTPLREMIPGDVRIVIFVEIKSAAKFLFTKTSHLKGKIHRKVHTL